VLPIQSDLSHVARRSLSRRLVAVLAPATLGLAALVAIPPAVAHHNVSATDGVFTVRSCPHAHTLRDDPIVYPGKAGAAHLHEFFGNTSTDAYSTTKSLRAAKTNCARPADKAAYWVPTLYEDGKRVAPRAMIAYYRTGTLHNPEDIQPFPLGLRMIAGNGHATSPQNARIVNWNCTKRSSIGASSSPPTSCREQSQLRLRIEFPNCWDGRRLTSSDQSHTAYSHRNGGWCPRTHPVEMPSMKVGVQFPISGTYGKLTLSSGSTLTGHADFWNAWGMGALTRLVERCLHGAQDCKGATD
jgi:hypothetical protein